MKLIAHVIGRSLTPLIFRLCLTLLTLTAATVNAQGPNVVAVGDRHLWTERVNSANGFDKASRAAILAYVQKLQEQKDRESRTFRRPSVSKWLYKELDLSFKNYQLAAKSCSAADWTCIADPHGPAELSAKAVAVVVPQVLLRWKVVIEKFATDYISEQVRLAALFPRTTSEIDLFDDNEFNGERLPDREFFLTFDDGPTLPGGNTDGVLQMLSSNKKTAVFFLLGGNLKARLRATDAAKVADAYRGQCIGSHGWQHVSHDSSAVWGDGRTWKTSVTDTDGLLRSTFTELPGLTRFFRPPYGQRRADSGEFFRSTGLHVALWNIDSQDWNPKMSAEDVTNRIEALMLIKRHGVLLFHDVHPKAKTAVPAIIDDFASAVDWGDCQKDQLSLRASTDARRSAEAFYFVGMTYEEFVYRVLEHTGKDLYPRVHNYPVLARR